MLQEAQERPLQGERWRSTLTAPLFIVSVSSCLKGNTTEGMRGGSAGGVNAFVSYKKMNINEVIMMSTDYYMFSYIRTCGHV